MKLSQITALKVCTDNVFVDNPSILIYLPDSDISYTSIYNSGLLLNNCRGIVVKSSVTKIPVLNKNVNGKKIYYELKNIFHNKDNRENVKKISVISTLNTLIRAFNNNENSEKFYYLYFDTIASEILRVDKDIPEKLLIQLLIQSLSKTYNTLKRIARTDVNVDVIFGINSSNGKLFNLLKEHGKLLLNQNVLKDTLFFDNFAYATDLNGHLLPILDKLHDKIRLIPQQLSKLIDLINLKVKEDIKISVNKESSITAAKLPNEQTNIVSNIADSLANEKAKISFSNDNKDLVVEIDTKAISKILKKYRINDPNILVNTKSALIRYIKETGIQPTKDKLEILILKAINKTINGTDKLDRKYIYQPELLFKKLSGTTIYQNKLELYSGIPSVKPEQIIDLTYVTGQFRHKFEFEDVIHENIAKLFKALETRSKDPVKVVKIEHETVDTNTDRFIQYNITLQNLTGENKEPYVVSIKVPALVNERYFKIGGKTYIMPSQQFLKPLTKTEKNEVRLLTNYAIARIILVNVFLDITDFKRICDYIRVRYKDLVKNITDTRIEFKDGSVIDVENETVYNSSDETIVWDDNEGILYRVLSDGTRQELNLGKYEFIYMKIAEVTNDDFTREKIAYFQIHLGGQKMPFIMFLLSQKDIMKILLDYGIDYKIIKDRNQIDSLYYLTNDRDEILVMYPETPRQTFLLNGLRVENINYISNFSSVDASREIVDRRISRGCEYIDHMIDNIIDPVTKELLEYEDLPTNVVNLLEYNAIDKLLNDPVDHITNLGIYRARMSELILNLLYSQLMRAHRQYSEVATKFHPDNARIYLDPDFVMKNLIIEGKILQYVGTISPVQEIMLASRVTRLGKGGVPSENAIKPGHRNIDDSHIGNLSANSTSESSGVGIILHHTLTPVIVNRYGSYGSIDLSASGWHFMSADEALIPFGNQISSDRMVLAVTHTKQVTPTDNTEPPLVQTGAEYVIPALSSSRFIHRAKKDGEVLEVVKNKYIKVKYNDGTIDYLDIVPRVGHTKRFEHLLIELNTLNPGDKFKKNQPLAWCKNFSPEGIYCSGRNVKIAVMEYLGYVHEDAYAVSKKYAETTTTDIVKEVHVIIPPKCKVDKIETEIGKQTKHNEVLLSYSFDEEFDEYVHDIIEDIKEDRGEESIEDEFQSYTLTEHQVELKSPGGEIIDIKVFLNNKQNVDRKLKELHAKLVKETATLIEKLKNNTDTRKNPIKALDNLDVSFFEIGGHKYKGSEFKGARVVYYIKVKKPIRLHDKLSNRLVTAASTGNGR